MSTLRFFGIFLLLCILNACVSQVSPKKASLGNGARVFLYLQPMSQEGNRLRFSIEEIAAVGEDGSHIPLSMSFNEVAGLDLEGRQTLLATGEIPPGFYQGIAIKIGDVSLLRQEEEAALLVPEEPILVKRDFLLAQRDAVALFLTFHPSQAIKGGFKFAPDFSLATRGRELLNLTGYVTHSGENILSVFNKRTMEIIDIIETEGTPRGIALNQNQGRLYIALSDRHAVEVKDIFTGERIDTIGLHLGDKPEELAIARDGRTLVSANRGSNTVSIIDTESRLEVSRVRVDEDPTSVVMSPSGLRAYVTHSLSNTLSVINLATQRLSATLSFDETPLRGAFNRRGDALYLITSNSPYLITIDPATLTVTDRIFIGMEATFIKSDTRNDLIFVGKKGGEISIIDPSSSLLIDAIRVDGTVEFMTIDDEENTLFVVISKKRRLQKINLISKKVMAELKVQEGGYAVGVMGER